MIKADFSPNAKIYWHDDIKALRLEWLNMHIDMDRLNEILGKGVEIMKTHNGSIWIADTYNSSSVFSKEVQQSTTPDKISEFASAADLSMMLLILPKNTGLESMATKRWGRQVKDGGFFEMREFSNLDDCVSWIKEQK